MSVVSWITNALAGGFSAAMLMSEWWAFISIPIAILGAFRRRCSWYTPLKYLGGAVVYAVLFHASLWLNTRLSVPDKLSATLFWLGVLMTCVGGLRFFIHSIRDTWQRTNSIQPTQPLATAIFSCPHCAQQLRVPSGRGRIRITCTICSNVFEEST
jgi:hypothetical protein